MIETIVLMAEGSPPAQEGLEEAAAEPAELIGGVLREKDAVRANVEEIARFAADRHAAAQHSAEQVAVEMDAGREQEKRNAAEAAPLKDALAHDADNADVPHRPGVQGHSGPTRQGGLHARVVIARSWADPFVKRAGRTQLRAVEASR